MRFCRGPCEAFPVAGPRVTPAKAPPVPFAGAVSGLKLSEPELLMRGAINELSERTTGDAASRHAVLSYEQDSTGVQVLISRSRLEARDVGVADVLRRCVHSMTPRGRQLLLAPYRRGDSYAPQYAMFFDVSAEDIANAQTRPRVTSYEHRPLRTALGSRARAPTRREPRDLDDACFWRYASERIHLRDDEAQKYHPRKASFLNPDVPSIEPPEWPETQRLFAG